MVWGVRACCGYLHAPIMLMDDLVTCRYPIVGSCQSFYPLHRDVHGRIGFCSTNIRRRESVFVFADAVSSSDVDKLQLYFWTHSLSSPRCRNFLAWIVGCKSVVVN
jgi:hypothetical protein